MRKILLILVGTLVYMSLYAPVMTVVQTFQIRRGQVMGFGTAISLSQLNIWHLRIWES